MKTNRIKGWCWRVLVLALLPFQFAAAAEKERSFSVVLWETPLEEVEFSYGVPGSSRRKPLEIAEMERLTVQEVKASTVEIHTKGKEGKAKVASVDLNPAYKSSLIVLMPKEDGSYETIVLNDDPKAPPFGSYLFRNLSDLELEGKLGDSEIKLPADGMVSISPKVKPKAELGLEIWHMPKGKKTFLQRNTWSYNPQKYLIVFLYAEESRSGRVKLMWKGINLLKGSK